MQTPGTRLNELFQRWYNNEADETEKKELFEELAKVEDQLPEMMKQAWEKLQADPLFTNEQKENMLTQILGHKKSTAKIFTLRRVAAAASIILAIGFGSYFLFFNKSGKKDIVKTNDTVPHDVTAPKGTKAIITLTDGRTVALDSINNGTIAIQGNVNVVKTADGKIVYQSAASGQQSTVQYNTLSNPRGSKVIDMTLADGSHVWLNAGSSMTYPTSFVGTERKISMTGEAYFEVAHDALKKFIVSANGVTTEVLGTHFNVNSYTDERDVRITLLEGWVKVTRDQASGLLRPGQQAQVTDEVKIVNGVDLEETMAWKNGLFQFESADVKTILRQFARWYDVEVIYEGELKDRKFFGIVKRDSPLSAVLQMLKANDIKFRIEGKKLYVTSG